ncbi:MAG: hypothetical protein NT162_03395 [Candidatus Woesebacteria bacterium]|nr:hypothetical protein [Candidatus Woesebacteria bacterium]
MTYLEELKEADKELEATGFMDWDLKEEIKKLERIQKIFKKLRKLMEKYEQQS